MQQGTALRPDPEKFNFLNSVSDGPRGLMAAFRPLNTPTLVIIDPTFALQRTMFISNGKGQIWISKKSKKCFENSFKMITQVTKNIQIRPKMRNESSFFISRLVNMSLIIDLYIYYTASKAVAHFCITQSAFLH